LSPCRPRDINNDRNKRSSRTAATGARKERRPTTLITIYHAEEPDAFLDPTTDIKEIRAMARKIAGLEGQLAQCRLAEQTELQKIQASHKHATQSKQIVELLQLENETLVEQHKHANTVLFTIHQEIQRCERASQEILDLYQKVEQVYRAENTKHKALTTQHLPQVERGVQHLEKKIQRCIGLTEWEKCTTKVCQKYMAKLVEHFQQNCSQADLVVALGTIALGENDNQSNTSKIDQQDRNKLIMEQLDDSSTSSEEGDTTSSSEYDDSSSEYESSSEED